MLQINTGFFAARPTDLVKQIFARTVATIAQWKVDQLGLNYIVRSELKVKYSKNLKALDKTLYANGMVHFRHRKNAAWGIRPLVVHANYVSGSVEKQKLLEQANMWYL